MAKYLPEKGTAWTGDKALPERLAEIERTAGTPLTWGLPLLLLLLIVRMIFK